MAISYAANAFKFVDSQYGAATGNDIKKLVPVVSDRRYHKAVQKKNIFARLGIIGPDTYSEGGFADSAPGFPIVRKTELQAQPGDTIKMGLRSNLATTVNTGVVGATQLVDSEQAWTFKNKNVKIERQRQGTRTDAGMNVKRNPYDSFESQMRDLLTDWGAQIQDTAILYAAHYGYAPHMFRSGGTDNYVPTACPNILFGNSFDTTRTIASLSPLDDKINADTFEIGGTFMEQNDFDPVMINGQKFWLWLISPKAAYALKKDDRFRNAWLYARERGASNPLFTNAEFVYDNNIIFKYDKIRTVLGGNNPAGLTTATGTGGDITEAAYTGIGGGLASTDLHQALCFGANAIALAEGEMKGDLIRKEDDYTGIIGRAVDMIYGATRLDWANEGATTLTNQSMLQVVNSLV